MYNKRYKKSNKKIYGTCTIIVLLIYTISICYSTLQQQLEINGLVKVRRQENIRVTGVVVEDSASSATSNWEEYDVKNISAGISLPYNDSSITYKVKVTNFGNVDMGIYNIDGLDDKLEYEITGYTLKEKIEKSGNKKEFQITIKYRDGKYDENNTTYNILLNFEFRSYYKITYIGFPDETSSLPQEIMERDKLIVDLKDYQNARYKITEKNIELLSERYTFEKNILTITSVEGDIEITYKKILDIELVLRENDKNNYITEDLVGGMYRYQGKDNVNNWICFGTTDKELCTSADGIDKYMYRIIGITEDGQLALIKETVVREKSTTSEPTRVFNWNDKSSVEDCGDDGEKCTWPDSKLFNRLNGLCETGNENCTGTGTGTNGQTNIFINSDFYDYLKSGSVWDSIINVHSWKYGFRSYGIDQNDHYMGKAVYKLESELLQNSINAKIGLQYIHDYLLAYPGGSPGNQKNAVNAWIHIDGLESYGYTNDTNYGYNKNITEEWSLPLSEIYYGNIRGWHIDSGGLASDGMNIDNAQVIRPSRHSPSYMGGVRPVFYLTSDIALKKGTTGTKDNPYILDIEREYEYTGEPQEFVAPKDGYYQIELWGASGDSAVNEASVGRGAYTKGTIELNKNDKLYIFVGQKGVHGNFAYNGGGTGEAPGGGATDVRLYIDENGTWSNFESLKSRIMVAAGGGGGAFDESQIDYTQEYQRGDGGGLNGLDANFYVTNLGYGYSGHGATQTSGGGPGDKFYDVVDPKSTPEMTGKFGIGGYSISAVDNKNNPSSGGGGGYYGGGHGNHPGNSWTGGGGGSSFISGYPGCKAIDKDSTEDHIIPLDIPNHYSGKVFTDYKMIAGNEEMPTHDGLRTMTGNTGNGFAKITFIK